MWKPLCNLRLQAWMGLRSLSYPQHVSKELFLETETPTVHQNRSTFILKRKWPPGLHKKNQRPKKLNARHFVYELVEDSNIKKMDDLKLILTTYVEGLGHQGDHVSVRPNYGYYKLLLLGLAVYATPENIAKYKVLKATDEGEKDLHSSPYVPRTVSVLSKLVMSVAMNKEVPWQVEPWHIRASFRKIGIHVPTEAIQLPEKPITGPDLSLQGKCFYVTVTINNLEQVKVQFRIHHWSTVESDRLPQVENHWKLPADPLFPEVLPTTPSSEQTTTVAH